MRDINSASFPIHYNEQFYKDILKAQNDNINKFAYYDGKIVGAVCGRIEDIDNPPRKRLYIMTLATLAPYRGKGIGSQLLQSILDYAHELRNVSEIALHVQISNDDALRFYIDRFKFTRGEMVENYYRRIDPPHCYILFKAIDTSHEKISHRLNVSQEQPGPKKADGYYEETS